MGCQALIWAVHSVAPGLNESRLLALTTIAAWMAAASRAAEKSCRKLGRRDRKAAFLIQQPTYRNTNLASIRDPDRPLAAHFAHRSHYAGMV